MTTAQFLLHRVGPVSEPSTMCVGRGPGAPMTRTTTADERWDRSTFAAKMTKRWGPTRDTCVSCCTAARATSAQPGEHDRQSRPGGDQQRDLHDGRDRRARLRPTPGRRCEPWALHHDLAEDHPRPAGDGSRVGEVLTMLTPGGQRRPSRSSSTWPGRSAAHRLPTTGGPTPPPAGTTGSSATHRCSDPSPRRGERLGLVGRRLEAFPALLTDPPQPARRQRPSEQRVHADHREQESPR